jgi:hypothetical protein
MLSMKFSDAPLKVGGSDFLGPVSCGHEDSRVRRGLLGRVGFNALGLRQGQGIDCSREAFLPAQKQVWAPWIPHRALPLNGSRALAVLIPAHRFWRLFFRQEVALS